MTGDNSWFFRTQEWLKTFSNQSTMVGEILGFWVSGMAKNYLTSPAFLETFLDFIRPLKWLKTQLNQSTVAGDNSLFFSS